MSKLKMPAQYPAELDAFVEFVKEQNVRSYLEIGSLYGGTLWHVARAMPVGSVVVSVDRPKAKYESAAHLMQCVKDLRAEGYDAHSIIGDSTDRHVIKDARKRAPYDLCLIDANHQEPYVRADWANYGPMAKIVAFHDISWTKNTKLQVAKVWNEIKTKYRHQEIKLSPTPDNGFGILWR
jgi:predicted O-methyltransferase YrrM